MDVVGAGLRKRREEKKEGGEKYAFGYHGVLRGSAVDTRCRSFSAARKDAFLATKSRIALAGFTTSSVALAPMTYEPLQIAARSLDPHKAVVSADLGRRTVLTNNPWSYVALWLRRNKKNTALFYWEQAEQFSAVSEGLPPQSAPLLLYYCYMNAAKALLSAKGIPFNEFHGLSSDRNLTPRRAASEVVTIKGSGVFPSISSYYVESERATRHTLKELLFNMPFIHRTFCLTYTSQAEMFLPLRNCKFMADTATKNVHFFAEFAGNVNVKNALKRLPANFEAAQSQGDNAIKSRNSINWSNLAKPTDTDLQQLAILNQQIRTDVRYINGAQTLWYLRAETKGPTTLQRHTPSLVLAAMHRLSELSRYNPLKLSGYLDGDTNWLLNEFITMSRTQFIDEISCELTGQYIMVPNVRPA